MNSTSPIFENNPGRPAFLVRLFAVSGLLLCTACSQLTNRWTTPESWELEEPVLAETGDSSIQSDLQTLPYAETRVEEILPQDLLSRITREFRWSVQDQSPQISSWTAYFLREPDEFQAILSRAEPYLYFIAEQIEEQGLPMELAFLPFVESGFDPRAKSHIGAAGLWQFMPSTGRSLGLTQNWWIDERLSVVDSTRSALEYLDYLHGRFDQDWLLALAAYNTGEGNVSSELRRSGSEADFWSLHLNSETRNYVPKLLAVVHLLQNPSNYDLELPNWDDQPYFDALSVENQIDMRKVQDLSEDHREDIGRLNAQYVQNITFPQQGTEILVPLTAQDYFSEELAARADSLSAQYARYEVQNGDNLSLIADRHRVNLNALMALNQLNGNLIHPGDNLLIPLAAQRAPQQTYPGEDGVLAVEVRSGDSLSVIAERYQMGLSELVALNNIRTSDPIFPGQELRVRAPTGTDSDPLLYQVARGDSLSVIANRFNILLDDLLTWNGLHGREVIYPGQQLAIWIN